MEKATKDTAKYNNMEEPNQRQAQAFPVPTTSNRAYLYTMQYYNNTNSSNNNDNSAGSEYNV